MRSNHKLFEQQEINEKMRTVGSLSAKEISACSWIYTNFCMASVIRIIEMIYKMMASIHTAYFLCQ